MRALTLVLGLFWAAFAAAAASDDYAGVVKTVRGTVAIERAGARLPAAPGTRLQQGDRIVTGATGYIGATLRDDTLLTLGPNGVLSLDSYAFDAKTHEGSFLASLTKGVLSVVTGLIARRSPDAFAVKTPISTMGVRGTEFIVEAGEI
ncbi:MAG TPA: FecR domain-containing protein [Burkholderiales bacterium]|nr:FecR domain-containing protein [Burkholderiales bacterium]